VRSWNVAVLEYLDEHPYVEADCVSAVQEGLDAMRAALLKEKSSAALVSNRFTASNYEEARDVCSGNSQAAVPYGAGTFKHHTFAGKYVCLDRTTEVIAYEFLEAEMRAQVALAVQAHDNMVQDTIDGKYDANVTAAWCTPQEAYDYFRSTVLVCAQKSAEAATDPDNSDVCDAFGDCNLERVALMVPSECNDIKQELQNLGLPEPYCDTNGGSSFCGVQYVRQEIVKSDVAVDAGKRGQYGFYYAQPADANAIAEIEANMREATDSIYGFLANLLTATNLNGMDTTIDLDAYITRIGECAMAKATTGAKQSYINSACANCVACGALVVDPYMSSSTSSVIHRGSSGDAVYASEDKYTADASIVTDPDVLIEQALAFKKKISDLVPDPSK